MAEKIPDALAAKSTRSDSSDAQVEITLKYDGQAVKDGTMHVDDVVAALRGFSSAYSKVAARHDPKTLHDIRVSTVEKSSFAVVILAWVSGHPAAIAASGAAIQWVVATIIQLVKINKATKGRSPATAPITFDGDSIVLNAGDNVQISMTKQVYEIYQSGIIEADLNRIVEPLEKDKIDDATLSAKSKDGLYNDGVTISSSEKDFFQAIETSTVTSRPLTLDGYFVSLNKETNRGLFRMLNGTKVRYRLIGEDPTRLYPVFARKDLVRVECIASFDENLEVKQLDIISGEPVQREIF